MLRVKSSPFLAKMKEGKSKRKHLGSFNLIEWGVAVWCDAVLSCMGGGVQQVAFFT